MKRPSQGGSMKGAGGGVEDIWQGWELLAGQGGSRERERERENERRRLVDRPGGEGRRGGRRGMEEGSGGGVGGGGGGGGERKVGEPGVDIRTATDQPNIHPRLPASASWSTWSPRLNCARYIRFFFPATAPRAASLRPSLNRATCSALHFRLVQFFPSPSPPSSLFSLLPLLFVLFRFACASCLGFVSFRVFFLFPFFFFLLFRDF